MSLLHTYGIFISVGTQWSILMSSSANPCSALPALADHCSSLGGFLSEVSPTSLPHLSRPLSSLPFPMAQTTLSPALALLYRVAYTFGPCSLMLFIGFFSLLDSEHFENGQPCYSSPPHNTKYNDHPGASSKFYASRMDMHFTYCV